MVEEEGGEGGELKKKAELVGDRRELIFGGEKCSLVCK